MTSKNSSISSIKQHEQTAKEIWTDEINIEFDSHCDYDEKLNRVLTDLCRAFSSFPFMAHSDLKISLPTKGTQLLCSTDMTDKLVGNVAFGILHGGVTATMLDSVGGVQIMANLIIQELQNGTPLDDILKRLTKVATLDLRIDYLKPGKGKHFVATADIMRLGRKSSTARMQLVNEENTIIAIATASYVY